MLNAGVESRVSPHQRQSHYGTVVSFIRTLVLALYLLLLEALKRMWGEGKEREEGGHSVGPK